MYKILALISYIIIATISSMGYLGIILAMALESACIPLPSEVIMPFSGYLISQGRFSLLGVAVAGALGCSLGSALAYYVGVCGGRPFIERYGRYFLISRHELERADRWFVRYGDKATFISRLLPVIRTFISLPAGIARMNFKRFLVYSFLGSLPWTWSLAFIGMKLGEHWERVGDVIRKLDFLIVAGLIGLVAFFVWRKLVGNRSIPDAIDG